MNNLPQDVLIFKTRSFQAINRLISDRLRGRGSARAESAFCYALLLSMAFIIVSAGIQGTEWWPFSWNMEKHTKMMISVVVSVFSGFFVVFPAVYFSIIRFSHLPKSLDEELDELLAHYEPIDLDAFKKLQDKTRALGVMSNDVLKWWIGVEGLALNAMIKRNDSPLGYKFLSNPS